MLPFPFAILNMHFKYFLQASGLALLTGAVTAQLDADALGLEPILGSNPLGGILSRRDPQLDADSLGLEPILGTNPLGGNSRRAAARDAGSMLGGGGLGGLLGGGGEKDSPSAAPSSSSATPTSAATPASSSNATPTPTPSPSDVQQSNKGILGGLGGRDMGGSEADSTIPLNVGSLLGGRDMARRSPRGSLGAGLLPDLGSDTGASTPSITPTSSASASASPTPTSMQTKVRSTPVGSSAQETKVPNGSSDATPVPEQN